MDEAMHPLTMLCFGLYGEVLPNQNGAPMRTMIPWKYGFKSTKAIVKMRFMEKQPDTAWNKANAHEYGFYSNVNPRSGPSALEPGDRTAAGRILKTQDADVQRLRRPGGQLVCGHGSAQELLNYRARKDTGAWTCLAM